MLNRYFNISNRWRKFFAFTLAPRWELDAEFLSLFVSVHDARPTERRMHHEGLRIGALSSTRVVLYCRIWRLGAGPMWWVSAGASITGRGGVGGDNPDRYLSEGRESYTILRSTAMYKLQLTALSTIFLGLGGMYNYERLCLRFEHCRVQ